MTYHMMEPVLSESTLDALYLGEPAAVEEWFYRFSDPLYTFIYYRVNANGDIAADITQETFLKALGDIQEFNPGRGSMLTWLTTLSRNIIRKHLRDQPTSMPNFPSLPGDLVILYEQIATAPLPDEVVVQKETADLVRATLTTIPGNYNQVLYDYYWRSMGLKEISRLRGLSESSVKSLLHRARLAFRETFTHLAGSLYYGPSPKGGNDAR
jgi:RNA polymerase sigma-70 factor, ECF subfamily